MQSFKIDRRLQNSHPDFFQQILNIKKKQLF